MTILDKIIKNKRIEVERRKLKKPLESFVNSLENSTNDFKNAISKNDNKIKLIAEIKKTSPSEGIINKDFDIRKIAKIYDKYADAISVITDEKFFNGDLNYMKIVKEESKLPILCKDFIIDEYQIYEARLYKADAILLISSILDLKEIDRYIEIAEKLNMNVLLENKNENDLKKSLQSSAKIIGINNRNLDDFSIDLNRTKYLSSLCKNKIIVSESGIHTNEDLQFLENFADAVLIGTGFMKSKNLEKKIQEIFNL